TLQDSLDNYRAKISSKNGGKRRNVAAAYELALKAARPYLSGDQISYYVTGHSAKIKVAPAAKMATEYDAAQPDENVPYYLAKLDDLYEKFRPFVERAGLFMATELEAPPEHESGQADLFAGVPARSEID